MKVLLILCVSLFSVSLFAKSKKNVKYEYKKYERFDLDALDVEAAAKSPGDLSIGQRFKTKQKNKIPERYNFNREMKRAVDSLI